MTAYNMHYMHLCMVLNRQNGRMGEFLFKHASFPDVYKTTGTEAELQCYIPAPCVLTKPFNEEESGLKFKDSPVSKLDGKLQV